MNALKTVAAACVAAIALTAAPAFAGECPADQVGANNLSQSNPGFTRTVYSTGAGSHRSGTFWRNLRKVRYTSAIEGAPTMPSGVTDEVIASIDLTGRYGVPGRNLRMRRLVVEPGGVVPLHSHAERPANIYVVEGEVTEYSTACRVGVTHRAGEVVAEQGDISHWWRNNSRRQAVLISADLPPLTGNAEGGM